MPQYDLKIIGQTDRHGTTVRFRPDAAIFDDVTAYSFDTLKKRLRELAFLNAGIRIELTDKRGEGQDQVFHYEGGIRSFIEYLNKNREVLFPEPLFFSGVKDGTAVEVSMQYNDSYTENVFSFANNIDTVEGGTHLEGFRRALTRVINDYGRKAKILKDSDANLTGDDIRLIDWEYAGEQDPHVDIAMFCIYALYEACKAKGVKASDKVADICEALTAQFTDSSFKFDGLTGTGMTWKTTGEVSKSPKGMVIKNGAYEGMDK